MSRTSLTQTVIDRRDENTDQPLLSQAALEALALSDKFESVTAREYILPLDALAGFPRQVAPALPPLSADLLRALAAQMGESEAFDQFAAAAASQRP